MNSKINRYSIICGEKEKEKRLEFGNEFREERNKQRFSIAEMANKLNISIELLKRIESGCVSPDSPGIKEKLLKFKSSQRMKIG